MATTETWTKKYNKIIVSHHKYNTQGYSLKEFLSLSDAAKKVLLKYYSKKSLLDFQKETELFNEQQYIIPCPDTDLCNFLQS